MRMPLRQKSKLVRGQASSTRSIPAPVGGWNTRDELAHMADTDAVQLDNWFPRASYCEIRDGYWEWTTGQTGTGKTLASYSPPDGNEKMFCFDEDDIWNVSVSGAAVASGLGRTNGKHQYVNFGDGTNNYLIAVNGVDKPAYFNGTSWTAVDGVSSPALTGLTTTSIIGLASYKGRLFFIEKDSLSFWYLAAGAAGGALTEFKLDGEASRGGYLMAVGTWTLDAGAGLDDKIVFVTSGGECIVYEGTNPSAANTWVKIGTYYIGKPLGRRCLCQFGGDLIIITESGAFPLSAALQSAAIDYKLALSNKIEPEFTKSAKDYGSVFGWMVLDYPAESALIVNVPLAENGTHYQYVMNTITKAWCRFKAWNAEDFVLFGGALYFCAGTKVYRAWNSHAYTVGGPEVNDNGADIVAEVKTAYSYFGKVGMLKHFKLFRPVLITSGGVDYVTGIDMDFSAQDATENAIHFSPPEGSKWGNGLWGTARWSGATTVIQDWTSPTAAPGFAASGQLKIANNQLRIRLMSFDYVYEYGNIVG